MKHVVFVGDKPSKRNTSPAIAFVGTPSFVNLCKWIPVLSISKYTMINSYTHDDVTEICRLFNMNNRIFIALGNDASKVLDRLDIPHFKLPHPSPRNRKLNNSKYIAHELLKCEAYILCRRLEGPINV
jgi:hypothetical protein